VVISKSPSSRGQLDLSLYRAAVGGDLGEFSQFPFEWTSTDAARETTPLSLPPSSEAQPIPFDSTGDLRIDLLESRHLLPTTRTPSLYGKTYGTHRNQQPPLRIVRP